MSLLRRYRIWRFHRRLGRMLVAEGWQKDALNVFTGNVLVTERRYAKGTLFEEALREIDE